MAVIKGWFTATVSSLSFAVPLLAVTPSVSHAADKEISNDSSYRWGENKVIVNPANPDNVIIATQGIGYTNDCQQHSPDCKLVTAALAPGLRFPQAQGLFTNPKYNIPVAFVSFDRGKSWKRVDIPVIPTGHPDLTGGGDPNVTATADGTLYFSFDDNNWGTPDHALPDAAVSVSKSTDGGLTWSTPVITGTPVDGPKIVADISAHTIYEASSTSLGPHSTGDASSPAGTLQDRWVVSSKDGVHWTTPHPMGGTGNSMAAAHGVFATAFTASAQRTMFGAPNGELCGGHPQPCVVFETTTDAGTTWSRHVLNGPAVGQAMVAADPIKAGHFTLAVLVGGKEFDVYQTHDAGETWSGSTVVTEDATKTHHFLPWMDYSPQGVLGIMWRTSQPAPGQSTAGAPSGGFEGGPVFPYNVWVAVSKDGGATFSEPLEVSAADSPAPQAGMFANAGDDYSSIALYGDNVYVTWADWRSKERAMYFSDTKLKDFTFKK